MRDTSSATKRRLLKIASLFIVDLPFTYNAWLRETSSETKRRLFNDTSPETNKRLFINASLLNVDLPFTIKPALIVASFDTNNLFDALRSFANNVLPATYKLLFKDISAPTNNLPFNDKSRPTNKYLSVRILPLTSIGNSIFVEELITVKSVPLLLTNIPVALLFKELPTLNGGINVAVLAIKVYLFPR